MTSDRGDKGASPRVLPAGLEVDGAVPGGRLQVHRTRPGPILQQEKDREKGMPIGYQFIGAPTKKLIKWGQ